MNNQASERNSTSSMVGQSSCSVDAGCLPARLPKPRAFFLTGPTAVGKTAVAQWIAERHDFDVLSADSMLVYRGMDVGTAKPSALDQSKVRYWGVDLVTPQERFSVGAYRQAAHRAIESVISSGRGLIVAGGTGLYIKSLTDGLTPRSPMNVTIRLRAERLLREKGVGALQDWLKAANSVVYESLPDKKNPRRLIRALECACSEDTRHGRRGSRVRARRPIGWMRGKASPRIFGLILPSDQLYERIKNRVRNMYSSGLIEEVERLLAQGFESAPTACQAIGYAEAIDYLKKRCSIDEAIDKTIIRTRRLVKRQTTWFRHQANVDWLEIEGLMPVADIARKVLKYWHSHGPTPIVRTVKS